MDTLRIHKTKSHHARLGQTVTHHVEAKSKGFGLFNMPNRDMEDHVHRQYDTWG